MAWEQIPNFKDKYAKINERIHPSGARIIEVLYGARDKEGRPTTPESSADGHGHWIALEIDGVYQMLSWRHPSSEGGKQEYGYGRRNNALADLEADIASKESLCIQAENLSFSQDWGGTSAKYKQLSEEWKKIYNWHTPKEKQLWDRFQAAKKTFYGQRDKARAQKKQAKQAIIAEARSLSTSSDWKAASQRFKELMDNWKSIGSVGKPDEDSLWEEFNAARQAFNNRRTENANRVSAQFENNRRQKQALINEARSVAQCTSDWKASTNKLNDLMTRWKTIGSAGREHEDELWKEFNSIRHDFFESKHRHHEQQENRFLENARRKEQIVQEASGIASRCDYSSYNTERMKELDREWKEVGFAGKDKEDQLWNLFQKAKNSFWTGKRAYSAQRQQEYRIKLNEAINRKRMQISNLQSQIYNIENKMYSVRKQEYIDNMREWISEKEERIRELEIAIRDMESRL